MPPAQIPSSTPRRLRRRYPQHGYGEPDSEFDEMVEDDEEPRSGRRALMIVACAGRSHRPRRRACLHLQDVHRAEGRPSAARSRRTPARTRSSRPRPAARSSRTPTRSCSAAWVMKAAQPPAAASEPQQSGRARIATRRARCGSFRLRRRRAGIGGIAARRSGAPSPPGVMLDNFGPGQPPPGAVRAGPPPAMPMPRERLRLRRRPFSRRRCVRAVAPPPVKIVTPAADEAPPAPPRQMAQAAPPKVAVPRAPAPAPTPVSAPQTTGTSGYVAVLSSQKSRMDALKVFADLQLKYGDVLTSRTPDVQEADLSARGLGTMYRLVVGPPGSRDAARGRLQPARRRPATRAAG